MGNLRETQDSAEALAQATSAGTNARATQVSAEALAGVASPNLRETQDSGEALVNAVPFSFSNFNNTLLLYVLTHRGPSPWSTYSAFPPNLATGFPTRIITIKEVQIVRDDASDTDIGVLFSGDDGNIYQMFAGDQDGTVQATAQTYPLPDLSQLPIDFRDTLKDFRELWVEGEDLANWLVSYSVNQGASYVPPTKLLNRNKIGLSGRQIIVRFQHNNPSETVPLLSYMKINYDIQGQAQGGNY